MNDIKWVVSDDPGLLAECAAELFLIDVYRAPSPPHYPNTWLLDLEAEGVAVVVDAKSMRQVLPGIEGNNAVKLAVETERNSSKLLSMAQELGWYARSVYVDGQRCIRVDANQEIVFEVLPSD